MAQLRSCGNTEEHTYHGFHEVVEYVCAGKTACGVETHPPHPFEENTPFWCGGICGCGSTLRGVHGPGAHK